MPAAYRFLIPWLKEGTGKFLKSNPRPIVSDYYA